MLQLHSHMCSLCVHMLRYDLLKYAMTMLVFEIVIAWRLVSSEETQTSGLPKMKLRTAGVSELGSVGSMSTRWHVQNKEAIRKQYEAMSFHEFG